MVKKILLILFFLKGLGYTQGFYSLYQLNSSPASVELNPAYSPDAKFYFNIIGLSLIPSFNLVVSSNLLLSNNYSTPFLNANSYKNAQINIFIQAKADLFHFGFRVQKEHFFRYHLGLKTPSIFIFDRTLLTELFDTHFSGSFVLGDTYLSSYAYSQHVFGYTLKKKRYSLGMNIKYLNIFAGLNVDKVQATVNTHLNGDLNFKGAASAVLFYPRQNFLGNMFVYSGNYGFATDLGFKINVHPQISISASFIDFGFTFLNQTDVQRYELSGDISINTKPPNLSGNSISALDNLIQHTTHIFNSFSEKFTAINQKGKYQKVSFLPLHLYTGLNYTLREQHDLHFLAHLMTIPRLKNWNVFYDVGIGYIWRSPVFQPILNYHINNYSFLNIGLGFLWNIKAFQIHLLTDDILFSVGNTFIQLGAHWLFQRDAPNPRWGK